MATSRPCKPDTVRFRDEVASFFTVMPLRMLIVHKCHYWKNTGHQPNVIASHSCIWTSVALALCLWTISFATQASSSLVSGACADPHLYLKKNGVPSPNQVPRLHQRSPLHATLPPPQKNISHPRPRRQTLRPLRRRAHGSDTFHPP